MRGRTPLLLVAAALALLGVAWFMGSTGTPPAARAAAAPSASAPAQADDVPARAAEPSEPQSTPAAADVRTQVAQIVPLKAKPKPNLPMGALDVRVVWADTREPCAKVAVSVVPLARAALHRPTSAVSDALGHAHFEPLEAGPAFVEGDRGGEVSVVVAAGGRTEVELALPRGCRVEGRVVAAPGALVSQPVIWVYAQGSWRQLGECNSSQRFAFDGIAPGSYMAALAREWSCSRLVRVDCEAGDAVELELVVDVQGVLILGQVLDADEQPVEGAVVAVEAVSPPVDGLPLLRGKDYLTSVTDAEGRFAIAGQGKEQRLVVTEPRFALYETSIDCSPGLGRVERIVQLEAGSVLIGRATFDDGQPAAGALVWSGSLFEDSLAVRFAFANSDGRYRITGLRSGLQHLEATAADPNTDHRRAQSELTIASGTSTWNATLAADDAGATSREK